MSVPFFERHLARNVAFALTTVAALSLVGCGDADDDDDGDPGAVPATPFATVDADPLAPPGRITGDLGDGEAAVPAPDPDAPRDDDARVVAGEFTGPYLAPVPVPGDRYGTGGGYGSVPGSTLGVAGLYDASIGRPLGTDVRYVYITPDGVLIVYDYDLDPYGTGLNCYRDGRSQSLLRDPGRDRADDYLVDGRSVRIARETLGIGYGFTDTLDDDRDGDISEFLYYRYPRISGLSVIDFDRCR